MLVKNIENRLKASEGLRTTADSKFILLERRNQRPSLDHITITAGLSIGSSVLVSLDNFENSDSFALQCPCHFPHANIASDVSMIIYENYM